METYRGTKIYYPSDLQMPKTTYVGGAWIKPFLDYLQNNFGLPFPIFKGGDGNDYYIVIESQSTGGQDQSVDWYIESFSPLGFSDAGDRLQQLKNAWIAQDNGKGYAADIVYIAPYYTLAHFPGFSLSFMFRSVAYSKNAPLFVPLNFPSQKIINIPAGYKPYTKDLVFGGPLGEAVLGIELAFLGGALSAPASGTDVGAVATSSASSTTVESAIPTYIAAPIPAIPAIPEYIAAATPAAALPVDIALGTDASILGLTGGVTTETSSIYGTVENLVSQGKDIVSQYKPVISDITKLKTVYDVATGNIKQPAKAVPVSKPAQPSGAPVSQAGGLIPIGIILGLLLLAS